LGQPPLEGYTKQKAGNLPALNWVQLSLATLAYA